MPDITAAMRSLERALSTSPSGHSWRSVVANRVDALRSAYLGELNRELGAHDIAQETPWLHGRVRMLRRQQAQIADQIDALEHACLDRRTQREEVQRQAATTLHNIALCRQRRNDLIYETVALDLGGEQ